MIFHIALKDLLIIFKDRKAIIVMLLMPILIILILGSALGDMFSKKAVMEKYSIAVVNNDKGKFYTAQFLNRFCEQGEKLFDIKSKIDDRDIDDKTALEMLDDKELIAVVSIPKGFADDYENTRPMKIGIQYSADGKLKSQFVEGYTSVAANTFSDLSICANTIIDNAKQNNISISDTIMAEGIEFKVTQKTSILVDLNDKLSKAIIGFSERPLEKTKTVTALQYYAAGMLLMFILFGANMGTKLLVEEREMRTLARVMTANVGKTQLIIGKFMGLLFVCFVQALVLIVFTALFYGVEWGVSIFGVILVTLCTVFAGAGMGMFIAALAKTSKAADGIGQVFIQMFTVIGGGMIPIYVMPEVLKQISKITINFWGLKGYLDLMLGSGMDIVFQYCGILILMGIVYLAIGISRFKTE